MRTLPSLMTLSLAVGTLACEHPPGDAPPSSETAAETTTIGRAAIPDPVHPLPADATLMVNPERRLVGSGTRPGQVGATSISDWSGTVDMRIWMCSNGHSPVAHPVIRCSVDPGFVLVGGGAWAGGNLASAGALLTATYPFDPSALTTWEARSKDHEISNPHGLFVFAIGLSLDGVAPSVLRANMVVNSSTAGPAGHPSASLPDQAPEFLDLSGGAFVNYTGAGNMLVTAFPWVASSKDHRFSDPATITVYRLGVRRTIPGFAGQLEQAYKLVNSGPATTGAVEVTTTLDTGYVPVGIGGFAPHSGAGRMLYRVSPSDINTVTSFTAGSKDHVEFDAGSTWILLSQLRKKP